VPYVDEADQAWDYQVLVGHRSGLWWVPRDRFVGGKYNPVPAWDAEGIQTTQVIVRYFNLNDVYVMALKRGEDRT
jgi:hypothetical protein